MSSCPVTPRWKKALTSVAISFSIPTLMMLQLFWMERLVGEALSPSTRWTIASLAAVVAAVCNVIVWADGVDF